MCDVTKILDKVQKLLRLGESSNANEAALAMSMAQDILDRHNLTMGDVDSLRPEQVEEIGDMVELTDLGQRAAKWKKYLAGILATHNHCVVYGTYRERKQVLRLIGRETDVQAVRYLYAYLESEIQRLCKRDCRGMGANYANNWRYGFVAQVAQRLREARADLRAQTTTTALAKFDDRLTAVDRWTRRNMSLRRERNRVDPANGNAAARAQGREAGANVSLGRNSGTIGAGPKLLGA